MPGLQSAFFSSLFVCSAFISIAQSQDLRELQQQLATTRDTAIYVSLLNKAGYLYHLSNPDSTIVYGMRAQQIAARHNDKRGTAGALKNIATALDIKGLSKEALPLYTQSLNLSLGLQDTVQAANPYMNLAVTYSSFKLACRFG